MSFCGFREMLRHGDDEEEEYDVTACMDSKPYTLNRMECDFIEGNPKP